MGRALGHVVHGLLDRCNRFLTAFVCERDRDRRDIALGLLPMRGIGLHSSIVGFIGSIAFTVGTKAAVVATMGKVLHQFPEGTVRCLLRLRSGFAERRAALLAFVAAAGTTPLGVPVSWPRVHAIGPARRGLLQSVSAGAPMALRWMFGAPRKRTEGPQLAEAGLWVRHAAGEEKRR